MFLQRRVTWHGKDILDAIKKYTEELFLLLDSLENSNQSSSVARSKVEGELNSSKGDETKVSLPKEEAWRMWQEQGLIPCNFGKALLKGLCFVFGLL